MRKRGSIINHDSTYDKESQVLGIVLGKRETWKCFLKYYDLLLYYF